MTFYLKALKQKPHCPCEMIGICAFTKILCMYGVLLFQEATVTHDNHFLATLLTYAFDQKKRPFCRRWDNYINILHRILRTKTQILMEPCTKFSASEEGIPLKKYSLAPAVMAPWLRIKSGIKRLRAPSPIGAVQEAANQ